MEDVILSFTLMVEQRKSAVELQERVDRLVVEELVRRMSAEQGQEPDRSDGLGSEPDRSAAPGLEEGDTAAELGLQRVAEPLRWNWYSLGQAEV